MAVFLMAKPHARSSLQSLVSLREPQSLLIFDPRRHAILRIEIGGFQYSNRGGRYRRSQPLPGRSRRSLRVQPERIACAESPGWNQRHIDGFHRTHASGNRSSSASGRSPAKRALVEGTGGLEVAFCQPHKTLSGRWPEQPSSDHCWQEIVP